MSARAEEVRDAGVSVNFATRTLPGQRMSRTDYALMQVFIERAGTVVTKRELCLAGWGSVPQNDYGRLTSRAVDAAVARLRRKGVPLVNIWGVGWLLPDRLIQRHVARQTPASAGIISEETEIPSAA